MNIFALDLNPEICASYHCDIHSYSMLKEAVQLLSGVLRVQGIKAGYELTHKNNRCSVWARTSLDNWLWLKQLATFLNREWKERYHHNRNHKSFEIMRTLPTPDLPRLGLTPFALAMPKCYQREDPVLSYRIYYLSDKRYFAKWKTGKIPYWWLYKEEL